MLEAFIQDMDYDELHTNEHADIWGAAIAWYGDEVGAEYNYCIEEDGTNCSAIYSMHWDGDPNNPKSNIITDYGDFEHYDVEWDKPDWEQRLLDAMKIFVLQRI